MYNNDNLKSHFDWLHRRQDGDGFQRANPLNCAWFVCYHLNFLFLSSWLLSTYPGLKPELYVVVGALITLRAHVLFSLPVASSLQFQVQAQRLWWTFLQAAHCEHTSKKSFVQLAHHSGKTKILFLSEIPMGTRLWLFPVRLCWPVLSMCSMLFPPGLQEESHFMPLLPNIWKS